MFPTSQTNFFWEGFFFSVYMKVYMKHKRMCRLRSLKYLLYVNPNVPKYETVWSLKHAGPKHFRHETLDLDAGSQASRERVASMLVLKRMCVLWCQILKMAPSLSCHANAAQQHFRYYQEGTLETEDRAQRKNAYGKVQRWGVGVGGVGRRLVQKRCQSAKPGGHSTVSKTRETLS